jgi:hypothetical protein
MINKSSKRINNNTFFPSRDFNQVIIEWMIGLFPKKGNLGINQNGKKDIKSFNARNVKSDAVFIGWQETSSGNKFPLYNITIKNHPLYCSTVSDKTLRNQNLKIPQTPIPQKFMDIFRAKN